MSSPSFSQFPRPKNMHTSLLICGLEITAAGNWSRFVHRESKSMFARDFDSWPYNGNYIHSQQLQKNLPNCHDGITKKGPKAQVCFLKFALINIGRERQNRSTYSACCTIAQNSQAKCWNSTEFERRIKIQPRSYRVLQSATHKC